jgi:hypothetical protein
MAQRRGCSEARAPLRLIASDSKNVLMGLMRFDGSKSDDRLENGQISAQRRFPIALLVLVTS